MRIFSNLIIHISEALILYMYFNKLFDRKTGSFKTALTYILGFSTLFFINNFENLIVNIVSCFLIYAFIACLAFYTKKKTALFYSCIFLTIELFTEYATVFIHALIKKSYFDEYKDNDFTFFVDSLIAKFLLFVFAYYLTKFLVVKKKRNPTDKYSLLLLPLPIMTFLATIVSAEILNAKQMTDRNNWLFYIFLLFLICSVVLVFYVSESVQKSNMKIMQLNLEAQKSQINSEYYENLHAEYQKQKILVHDIKNHLLSINTMAKSENCPEIIHYVNEIAENFDLNNTVEYSGNHILDAILNHYACICREKGIKYFVDVRSNMIGNVKTSDMTSLIDNLLVNAIESAEKSSEKIVSISIYRHNANYVIIKTENSCDNSPKASNGKLISSKNDSNSHGIGTQSIKIIADKYNGNFNWSYDEENNMFKATVILHI